MPNDSTDRLIVDLALATLTGDLDAGKVQQSLQELAGEHQAPDLHDLRQRLRDLPLAAARDLANDLDRRLLMIAAQAHQAMMQGTFTADDFPQMAHLPVPPRPLGPRDTLANDLQAAAKLVRDRFRLDALPAGCSQLKERLEMEVDSQLVSIRQEPRRWHLVFGEEREAADPPDALEDAICGVDERHLDRIPVLAATQEERRLAMELLTFRFGPAADDWHGWLAFIQHRGELQAARRHVFQRLVATYGEELTWLRCRDLNRDLPAGLERQLASKAQSRSLDELVQDRRSLMTQEDAQALPGLSPTTIKRVPPPLPPNETESGQQAPAQPRLEAPPPPIQQPGPPPSPTPSIWREHVQPLLMEYWYLAAGLVFMVAGASLLAYLTWDRSPLLRYTIMPATLALFTIGLAEVGHWLSKRDQELRLTGLFLRGGALAFTPLNFLVVGAAVKAGAIPLAITLGILYLIVLGSMQRRWAGQVEPRLRNLLGWPLLLFNASIVVTAFFVYLQPVWQRGLTVALFYGLAGCLAVAAQRFLSARSNDQATAWFFGLLPCLVAAEVFIWVHVHLGFLPRLPAYAPLVILAGAALFELERHTASDNAHYHGESFAGYALIGGGLLLGFPGDLARLLSLTLAGLVWLHQARRRPGILHHWIGLMLLILAAVSLAVFPWFPRHRELNLLPALGIAIVLLLGGLRIVARSRDKRLAMVATDVQPIMLLLTAVTAVISQYEFRSTPWQTGLVLIILAGFFIYRGLGERRLGWIHSAMALLAVALPYLGCTDMQAFDFRANTMAFGLGLLCLLWLLALRIWPHELLLKARSTVLCTYGILTFAAMVQRVLLEGVPLQSAYDYAGPFLISLALVPAAYYSRSLLPGFLVAIILAVLFPALKAQFQNELEYLGWGSGLGSAASVLGLIAGAFVVRGMPFLRQLGPGDPWMGRGPFPWRRHDYTLFTIPILMTAGFLTIRSVGFRLPQILLADAYGWRTILALFVFAAAFPPATIYLRQRLAKPVLIHGAWLSALAGFLALQNRLPADLTLETVQVPLLCTLALLIGGFLASRCWRHQPWVMPLLGHPLRQVLDHGTMLLAAGSLAVLAVDGRIEPVVWLVPAVLGILCWQALRRNTRYHGFVAYLLLAAFLVVGSAAGPAFRDWAPALEVLILLTLIGELILLALEASPALHERLRPLATPLRISDGILTPLLAMVAIIASAQFYHAPMLEIPWLLLVILVGVLSARALGLSAVALPAPLLAIACLMLQFPDYEPRPLHLVLCLVGLPFVARALLRRWPHVVRSRHALLAPQAGWWLIAALVVSPLLMGIQIFMLEMGYAEGLAAQFHVFVAVVAYGATALYWRNGWLLIPAGIWLLCANVYTADSVVGPRLYHLAGMTWLHAAALGLAVTLGELAALQRWATDRLKPGLKIGGICLGIAIYGLLASNYFLFRNVAEMVPQRLLFSGLLGWLTGLYFRWLASEEPRPDSWLTGLYHLGVTLLAWCLMLLIPALRDPRFSLVALAAPAVYFYLRAELSTTGRRTSYAQTAEMLSYALLILYTFRGVFQMILFPDARLGNLHYHYHSPVVFALGWILLRLHALRASNWAAFYGGLGVMAGLYFGLTSYPGLSPFDAPVAAAWVMTAMAHILALGTYQQSPVRTLMQRVAALDALAWDQHRRAWGRCLLVASQVVILAGVGDFQEQPLMVTPLLAAGASIFIHQGILGRRPWYLVAGSVELLLGLHADFVLPVPGLIPADAVVWILLAGWLGVILSRPLLARFTSAAVIGWCSAALAAISFLHIFHHGPANVPGLLVAAAIIVLGAMTPMPARRPRHVGEIIAAALLPLGFVWLLTFHQIYLTTNGFRWLLALVGSVQLIATAAWLYQQRWRGILKDLHIDQPRLWQHVLWLGEAHGDAVHLGLTFLSTGLLGFGTVVVYLLAPPTPVVMMLWCSLWLWLAWSWRQVARSTDSVLANAAAEGSLLGAAVIVRRLLYSLGAWDPAYDVWASLAVSVCLAGARSAVHRQPRSTKWPLIATIFALPAVAIVWIVFHGLGTDLALVVVGLHAVTFTWMGHDRRKSPYNAVAVVAVVAFVWLLFWAKLDLRFVHAYVIPVGIGLLTLLQLFGRDIDNRLRNMVRLVTLTAMLGSTAYYVILDTGAGIGFHLTLLLLGLAAMGLGGWLRIRLYVVLGFAGLLLDLAVIGTRVFRQLDSTLRMMSTGLVLLLLGIVLVGGAALYKAHSHRIQAWLIKLRQRLRGWD